MKTTLAETTLPNISFKSVPNTAAFNVLIVYEDHKVGSQAMNLCEHLGSQLGEGRLLESHCWKLGDLQHPEALEGMLEAAASADMVLLAAHETTALSAEKKARLELGLINRHGRSGALVALLGRPANRPAAPSAMQCYLKDLAYFAGLEFFSVAFELPPEKVVDPFEAIKERAETVTSLLQGILTRKVALPNWVKTKEAASVSAMK